MFKHVIETQQVGSALLVVSKHPEPLWEDEEYSLTLRLNLFVHIELCHSEALKDVLILRDEFPIKSFLRRLHIEQDPPLKDLVMLGNISHEYDKFLYLSLCGYKVQALWCEGGYVCVSADKRLFTTSVRRCYGTVHNAVNLSGQMRREFEAWKQHTLKSLTCAQERIRLNHSKEEA